MDEKQLQLLWDLHGKTGGFASFDEFKSLMTDNNARKVYFDDANAKLGFKDYDEFETILKVPKKKDWLPSFSPLQSGGMGGSSAGQSKEENYDFTSKENAEGVRKALENRPREMAKEYYTDEDIKNEVQKSIQEDAAKVPQGEQDPIGHILNSKQYTGSASAQINAKRFQALNNAFQSADQAKNYLQHGIFGENVDNIPTEKLRQDAGNNITKQTAITRLDKARKVEQSFGGGTRTLEDAAIHYAAENGDENVKNLLEKGGGTAAIPASMKGEKVLQFVMNPDVRQMAAKNPKLKQELNETIANFPINHPEEATKLLAQAIADKREAKGWNSSFANIVSKESTDKIMDELVANGDIPANYRNLYAKEIRPKLGTWQSIGRGIGNAIPILNKAINEAPIPTPGLLENIETGAENVETGLSKSIVGLAGLDPRSGEEKTYSALEKQYSTPQFEPTSLLHKATMHGGQMIPFVASLAGGGEALQAANLIKSPALAQSAMMVLATHGDNEEKALTLFPNNKIKQTIYTGTMDALNGVLGKYLPGQQIPRLLAKGEPVIADALKAMVDGETTTDAAKNTITKFVANTVSGSLKGGEFTAAIAGIDDLLTQTLQGKGIDFSQTTEKSWDAFKTGLIAIGPLAAFEGALKNNKGLRDQIISMAANPDHYKELINQEAEKNPELGKLKDDILQNLDYIGKVYAETNLHGKEKEKYVINSLAEKVKLQKAEIATDPTIKKKYQQEAKNIHEIKDAALKGIPEEKVKENQTIRDVKELHSEGYLSKGASEMLESKKTPEAEGKFDEEKVKPFLKFVAQQSNNIAEDGKFNTKSDARKSAEKQYPSQLIDLANEMFPEYKKKADEQDADKAYINSFFSDSSEATKPEENKITENVSKLEDGRKEDLSNNKNKKQIDEINDYYDNRIKLEKQGNKKEGLTIEELKTKEHTPEENKIGDNIPLKKAGEEITKLEAERDAKIEEAHKPELPAIKEISDKELVKSKDRGGNIIRHDEITSKLEKLRSIINCIWQ